MDAASRADHRPAGAASRVLPAISGLLISMLLAALDQTIVGTAPPVIVGELGDLYGRKRMLQLSVVFLGR